MNMRKGKRRMSAERVFLMRTSTMQGSLPDYPITMMTVTMNSTDKLKQNWALMKYSLVPL